MDKSLLDSAVKLGLEMMASESDLPKASVEAVLNHFLVSEICDAFNYSVIQVLEEKRCDFEEFLGVYRPELLDDNVNLFSDWFSVEFVNEEFIGLEAGGLTVKVNSTNLGTDVNEQEKFQVSKLEALILFLESIGYQSKELVVEIGESLESWKLPYVKINLKNHGKSIYFNVAYHNGTFVVDSKLDLVSASKSKLQDFKVSFHENRPYLYNYHLLSFVEPNALVEIKDEVISFFRNTYSKDEFMAFTLDELGEFFSKDLNLVEFARYVLFLDINTVFEKSHQFEFAKLIWPGSDLRMLENMNEVEIVEKIKEIYPEFLDMYNLKSNERTKPIFNGYSLQNFAYVLGIEGRVIDKVPFWDLIEKVYGLNEDSLIDMGKHELLFKFHGKEQFLKTPLKDSKFNLESIGKGILAFANSVLSENFRHFNKNCRELLADWLWPES